MNLLYDTLSMPPNALYHLSNAHRSALLDALDVLRRLFWGPDTDTCSAVWRADFTLPFKALGDDVRYTLSALPDQARTGPNGLQSPDEWCGELEAEYVRLFVSHREGIAAPLYHSCYDTDESRLMGRPAHDMRKRLAAIGVKLADTISEPPDHIAVELEYLCLLLEKGWQEDKPELVGEAVDFATESLLPWVKRLRDKLNAAKSGLFYPWVADLLVSVLEFVSGQGGSKRRR